MQTLDKNSLEYINNIECNAKLLHLYIKDLLDYSMASFTRDDLILSSFSIDTVIRDTLVLY